MSRRSVVEHVGATLVIHVCSGGEPGEHCLVEADVDIGRAFRADRIVEGIRGLI
jgi:hypothetical protein